MIDMDIEEREGFERYLSGGEIFDVPLENTVEGGRLEALPRSPDDHAGNDSDAGIDAGIDAVMKEVKVRRQGDASVDVSPTPKGGGVRNELEIELGCGIGSVTPSEINSLSAIVHLSGDLANSIIVIGSGLFLDIAGKEDAQDVDSLMVFSSAVISICLTLPVWWAISRVVMETELGNRFGACNPKLRDGVPWCAWVEEGRVTQEGIDWTECCPQWPSAWFQIGTERSETAEYGPIGTGSDHGSPGSWERY